MNKREQMKITIELPDGESKTIMCEDAVIMYGNTAEESEQQSLVEIGTCIVARQKFIDNAITAEAFHKIKHETLKRNTLEVVEKIMDDIFEKAMDRGNVNDEEARAAAELDALLKKVFMRR